MSRAMPVVLKAAAPLEQAGLPAVYRHLHGRVTAELPAAHLQARSPEGLMILSPNNRRVAVVIPVYDPRYLADALDSVFMQSRPADEVIVVDDGSPDPMGVRRAVAPYGNRVKVVRQQNAGAAAARNAGIAATSASLIALLDADDRWLPHFLLEQTYAFDSDATLDLHYTDGLFVGDSPLAGRSFMSACPSAEPVTLEALLTQRCTVLLSSVVARRTAITAAGGFDPALKRGHDFDLWLRMARGGAHIRFTKKVLALYRVHADSLSGTAIQQIERPIAILERAVARMALSEGERHCAERRLAELRGLLARERGKDLLRRGDVGAARRALWEARPGLFAWKLQVARLGLYVAPGLVRRAYLARAASAAS